MINRINDLCSVPHPIFVTIEQLYLQPIGYILYANTSDGSGQLSLKIFTKYWPAPLPFWVAISANVHFVVMYGPPPADRILRFERFFEIKNDEPYYGLKEHDSVDVDNGFILATIISPSSVHDLNYLPYCTLASCHTQDPIKKVYADKGYYGRLNKSFLSLNGIEDRIMRKDTTTVKLTDYEREIIKKLAKKRYIVEQYFGLSHLYDASGSPKARREHTGPGSPQF